MIYYRTHASRDERRPPELRDWSPLSEDAVLSENVIGDYRYIAVTPPMVFAPPVDGAWIPVSPGWEMAIAGDTVFSALANAACRFKCAVANIDGNDWILPHVLDKDGNRFFSITYGGEDFGPILTPVQTELMALAKEIRTCHETNTWPEMPVRARWAARLLSVTYCVSPRTIGALAILTDDLVRGVLMVACGYYDD